MVVQIPLENEKFWGITSAFYHCQAAFQVATDAGISLYAVNQHSRWLAIDAVGCHIESFLMKNVPA